ncbi:unnamed protein product [Lactuca virosa]|uniref:Uncharacterized protein n=1 Tax=Lactuca virosa TaxID=75947 RepID=A0AAU9NK16_9ASTR|nr:unnamed protein product [Lactuca virosa]
MVFWKIKRRFGKLLLESMSLGKQTVKHAQIALHFIVKVKHRLIRKKSDLWLKAMVLLKELYSARLKKIRFTRSGLGLHQLLITRISQWPFIENPSTKFSVSVTPRLANSEKSANLRILMISIGGE